MKIIGISGRKQSGKNTVANYINGSILQNRNMIEDFYLNNLGELIIKTNNSSGQTGYGVFDVIRKDEEFINYAEQELWPYVKVYHFADTLKEMAVNLFEIDKNLVYGSNDDKNKKTRFKWSDMPASKIDSDECLSVREFLEYFGTQIVRKINYNAWANNTLRTIQNEQSNVAIIPDVRFPNEVKSIQDAGGIVIRLTRDIFHSDAEAEQALDRDVYDWLNFNIIVNNENYTIEQLSKHLETLANHWSNV